MTDPLDALLDDYVTRATPLAREAALADWNAATNGAPADYARSADLHKQLDALNADPETFARVRALRSRNLPIDRTRARQLELLYRRLLAGRVPRDLREEIIDLSSELERHFATFRGRLGERVITDNEIDETLRTSTDSEVLRRHWESSKQVGREVAPQVLTLVEKRNDAARRLGYRDYFQFKLDLDEIEETWLFDLFDELDRQTAPSFEDCKARIDDSLAHRFGIAPARLMPWHYRNRFFQDAPWLGPIDVDTPFRGRKLEQIVGDFYRGIGLEADDIIARSDLYERDGKNPHAFCIDIDRSGDIRTLQNLRDNAAWADTFLHELGHGVYSKFVSPDLPWLLRTENHTFATEGVALLFGRFASNGAWLAAMDLVSPTSLSHWGPLLAERSRHQALVFSRWTQVVLRFEQQLYADPRQDLNSLWWDLVERYQRLRRPPHRTLPGSPSPTDAPADWAAKIHIALYPVYYHDYQLGELYASQLHAAICREVFDREPARDLVYAGHPEVAAYLIEKVFRPGASQSWREFVASSTGSELSPGAFAHEFMTTG